MKQFIRTIPQHLQSSRQKATLWLWHHGGEWLRALPLIFYAHSVHWRQRHRWMLDRAPIQLFQWAMAVISGGLGIAFSLSGSGQSGSPVMDLCDIRTGIALREFLSACHLPLFAPHQALGLLLFISSSFLAAAVYEWPMDEDLLKNGRSEAAKEYTDTMLTRLLHWHQAGHMAGFVYWGMYTILTLTATKFHPSWVWFGVCFSSGHAWMYVRCSREYSRESAKAKRVQEGKAVLRLRSDRETATPTLEII